MTVLTDHVHTFGRAMRERHGVRLHRIALDAIDPANLVKRLPRPLREAAHHLTAVRAGQVHARSENCLHAARRPLW